MLKHRSIVPLISLYAIGWLIYKIKRDFYKTSTPLFPIQKLTSENLKEDGLDGICHICSVDSAVVKVRITWRTMAQRSKKHHFVPKVLQQRFIAEPKRIWYSELENDNRFSPPQLRNIQKTFRIRDYYTVLVGGDQSDIVETDFYGRIDDYLGKMLPNVLDALDRGVVPTFSGHSLDSVRKVVMEMAKRTPEFVKKHDDIAMGREIVETSLATLSDTTRSNEQSKLHCALENPSQLRMYGRNVRVQATINRSERIEEALGEFSVRWAVSETHHSFILSSLMAYRIGNGGSNGLSNPNMEIWMPIAPKASLVLIRDPENKIPLIVKERPHHIRQVNEFAMKNSRQIASHSKELMESLTGKRAKLV